MNARRLGESSGVLLFEDERGRLHFADLGIGWAATTSFVLALLAFILLANALLQALLTQGNGVLALALFGLGVGFAWLWRLAARAAARQRNRPLESLPVLFVIDFEQGLALDGSGTVFAPLPTQRFRRAFQVASSSRALVAEWPGGQLTLVRGNPFSGGIDSAVYELERRGFRI
jgi:hypothetical protein